MSGSMQGLAPSSGPPICIVTGGSSGIGLATAKVIAGRAERIGIVCRDTARGEQARREIRAASPHAGPIDVWVADLASFASVRSVARRIRSTYPRVDVLVNNAGAVFSKRALSEDGLEMHLATNYAGHFLLTALLIEPLMESERPAVVTLTSALHRFGRLRLDDLAFERPYHLVLGYAQSKLASVLFTVELARRTRGRPILANCVDPGFVRTGIHRGATGHQRWIARRFERFGRDPAESGSMIARIVDTIRRRGLSGRYWTPRGETRLTNRARDARAADALWRRSMNWLSASESEPFERLSLAGKGAPISNGPTTGPSFELIQPSRWPA